MNIVPEINLNKHPKDCKPYSLITAKNIKLSNDASCLSNEESILKHSTISNKLKNINGKVVGYIPCNTELIIFVFDRDVNKVTLVRYNEREDACETYWYETDYIVDKIIGTFTYNVNDELIISFSEFSTTKTPLKTANLDIFQANYDTGLDKLRLALNPEIRIPELKDHKYIKGDSPNGWYYFYIRYKINDYDYTKWFSFGYPILCAGIEEQQIVKDLNKIDYPYSKKIISETGNTSANVVITTSYTKEVTLLNPYGASDSFINNKGINTESIVLTIDNIDNNYQNYQIAYCCNRKDLNICKHTNDISKRIKEIEVNSSNFNNDVNVTDLITDKYNYYNVKNIINYQNRLYIANYEEQSKLSINYSKIKLKLVRDYINISDSVKDYKRPLILKAYETQSYPKGKNIKIVNERKEQTFNKYFDVSKTFNERKIKTTLLPNEYYSFYIHFVNKYGEYTNGYELKYDDIYTEGFEKFVNNTGITLYKTPNENIINNLTYEILNLKVEVNLNEVLSNNTEYIGYFVSYEKFEKTIKTTGIVTKADFQREDYSKHYDADGYGYWNKDNLRYFNVLYPDNEGFTINDESLYREILGLEYNTKRQSEYDISDDDKDKIYNKFVNHNLSKKELDSNHIKLFSADFDLLDNVDLTFDEIKIESQIEVMSNVNTLLGDFEIAQTLVNETEILNEYDFGCIEFSDRNISPIKEFKLRICVGGSTKDNRDNLGTCLDFEILENYDTEIKPLFNDVIGNIYKAKLINTNYKQLYTNKIKTLIKFTNVYYDSNEHLINRGLNGFITFNNFIVYNANGYNFYDVDGIVKSNSFANYALNRIKSLWYIQLPVYNDFMYECKEFKNTPQVQGISITQPSTEPNQQPKIIKAQIVTPQNSIDLFRLNIQSQDDTYPKVYVNQTNDYTTKFNKTVRRSNVIQDESLENGWRNFPIEGYKQIAENKGKITNIIALGNVLAVHTEHSLFMFDRSNTLATNDKNIQLSMPDIFDIDYREVFASNLGICGLQDPEAFIVDDYGYYFYDNDAHRFYRFGEGKIEDIDSDINLWLDKYKPSNVRFAADKENKRILISININNILHTISYNYLIKHFISFHSYTFNKAVNTKNRLYYIGIDDEKSIYSPVTDISNNNNYNYFENSNTPGIHQSTIAIICNDAFEYLKTLEFITYKLYKYKEHNNVDSVEGRDLYFGGEGNMNVKHPYAGDKLRVYNDILSTGILDVSVDDYNKGVDNFTKPYYFMGNWQFNYLRVDNEFKSRLCGNYFILEFVFGGEDTQRIDFETLQCQIIKAIN